MQSENTQPENIQSNSLPDNAYRELRPGEEYHPVMPAVSRPKEVTLYSVLFGIVMAIVFSAAAAYLGLRVGQVFEAAIPSACRIIFDERIIPTTPAMAMPPIPIWRA